MREGDITSGEGGRKWGRVCEWGWGESVRMRAQFQNDSLCLCPLSLKTSEHWNQERNLAGGAVQATVFFFGLSPSVLFYLRVKPPTLTEAAGPHATGCKSQTPSTSFASLFKKRTGKRCPDTWGEFKRKTNHHIAGFLVSVAFVLESSRKPSELWLKESGRGGEKASRSAPQRRRRRGPDAPPPEGASPSLGRDWAPDRGPPRDQDWPHSKQW